nr:hypothetical protein [Tanacetum cinerariifolium]
MVLPFLCSNDSELDTELPERHLSSAPHDTMVARWRIRVASRPSSPSGSSLTPTSTSEIPTSPILPAPPTIAAPSTNIISPIDAPPGIRQRRAILIRPGHDILVSRLYYTYPGGPCRALTVRKTARPLPSHRLPLRNTSLVTTIADSSTPSRFVYPPHARTSQGREAFRRWRSASFFTMYSPTTSESSAEDSSSESSIRPSRKRCRFRDSYSSKDSIEEDFDADVLADIETNVEVYAGIGMEVGVEVVSEDEKEYEAESSARGTVEIRMDKVIDVSL